MKRQEPALCPECPLPFHWKREALGRILGRQYTRQKEQPSALKICIERRQIMHELGPVAGRCPHFPRTETILLFSPP